MTTAELVLFKYYDAMNQHNIAKTISFLDDSVSVTFPDAERNWKGIDVATEKFQGMFIRMPSFKGRFTVVDTKELETDKTLWSIRTSCIFESANSEPSSREMIYIINVVESKIVRIDHL